MAVCTARAHSPYRAPWRAASAALALFGAMALGTSAPALAQTSGKKPVPAKQAAAPARAVAVQPAPVADRPLTDNELAVAGQVYVGQLPCELGKTVRLLPDNTAPGYFHLQMDSYRFRLRPVESRTGAVRLEDVQQGAVWIQLANKSMLMSQKLGRRLVDECAGEAQQQVAAALKLNPAPSLLDAPAPLVAPVQVAAPAAVTHPVAPPALINNPSPVPALVATDCRRPVGTPSLPSGAETC